MAETAADDIGIIDNPTPEQWDAIIKRLEGGGPKKGRERPAAKVAPAEPMTSVPGIAVDGGPEEIPAEPTEMRPSEYNLEGPLSETGPGRMFNRGKSIIESVPWFGKKLVESGEQMVENPDYRRDTLRMMGGFAGGGVGGALGFASPVPGGTVGGTLLGTQLGTATGDYLANITNLAQGKGDVRGHGEIQQKALTDTALTGGITAGLTALKAPAQTLFSKLMKVPPNAKELVAAAKEMGVDIGLGNMPGRGQFGVKVFSRVPILGEGIQKAAQNQAGQLVKTQQDLFEKVAARATDMDAVGQRALNAGIEKFQASAKALQDQAELAFRHGDEAGAIIPVDRLKSTAQGLLDAVSKSQGGLKQSFTAKEVDFLKSIAQRNSTHITTTDSKIIDNVTDDMLRRLEGKNSVASPLVERFKGINDEVLASVDHNAARHMTKLTTDQRALKDATKAEIEQQFGTMNPNIFGDMSKTGPANIKSSADMLDRLNNLKTADQVKEMRKAVGAEPLRQMGRVRLDQAWDSAMTTTEGGAAKFSGDKFRKAIGLDDPTSRAYNVTKELLEGSEVTMGQLDKLIKVADQVASAPIADVSTFIARAATLRGAGDMTSIFKNVVTAGIASGTTGMNPVGTLASMLFTSNRLAGLMRPGSVEAATFAMDKTASQARRIKGLMDLIDATPRETLDTMIGDWIAQHGAQQPGEQPSAP